MIHKRKSRLIATILTLITVFLCSCSCSDSKGNVGDNAFKNPSEKVDNTPINKTVELTSVFEEIEKIEEGPKRDALLLSVANQMKRDYLHWNRETVNDLLILDDLYKLSGETFVMPTDTKLASTNEILGKVQPIQQQQQAKKKKTNNKKQQNKKSPNPNRPTKK